MKRILPFLSLLLLVIFLPDAEVKSARAETGSYAVAASDGIWFYEDADENSGLFILPFSYYVKVVADGEKFCRVEYGENNGNYTRISGYCLKDELTFVDFVPVRPYLNYPLSLVYKMDGDIPVGSGAFNTVEKTVYFYGTYYVGTTLYYYVYADGKFDYVPASQEIDYDFNTDYLSSANGTAENKPSSGGLNGIQIAVICIVCALAVIVAFFVLRGKKPPLTGKEETSDS